MSLIFREFIIYNFKAYSANANSNEFHQMDNPVSCFWQLPTVDEFENCHSMMVSHNSQGDSGPAILICS